MSRLVNQESGEHQAPSDAPLSAPRCTAPTATEAEPISCTADSLRQDRHDHDHPSRDDLVAEVRRLRQTLEDARQDQSVLARREVALRESEAKYRVMVENANDAIVVAQDEMVRFVNPMAVHLSGYSPEELSSRPFTDFIHPHDRELVAQRHQVGMRTGSGRGLVYSFRVITREGATLWVEIRAVSILWEGRPATLNLLSDITERRRAERTITHLAYHDSLTGLPNRMLFQDRLSLALAQGGRAGSRLAVMLVDLDRFKEINDTHGHAAGDELLSQLGVRLRATLRRGDSVARMGGDEFMLLLPELARLEDVTEIADRVLAALREPFLLRAAATHISASLGVAVFPDDATDEESLLRQVDHAMYRAKRQGGDRMCRA